MKPALILLTMLIAALGIACDGRRDVGTPTVVATATATATVPPIAPSPTLPAATSSATPRSTSTGTIACSVLEERWRTDGLVRLSITPTAPKPGDQVTVRGTGVHAAGRYDLNISDLDEVEIKVGEIVVGGDLGINGTFVMPTLQERYSGNGVGPCLAVTIRGATAQNQRFISPMFARP